jgi:hypothetical protein
MIASSVFTNVPPKSVTIRSIFRLLLNSRSRKCGDGYASRLGESLAMELDALYFVQGLCREIALATVRATDYRHILDDKQIRSFAVTTRDAANLGSLFATNVTCY